MTTGAGPASDPYATPSGGTFTGTSGSGVFEITLTAALAGTAASPGPIFSGSTNIYAETYNGAIPGPTFRLTVGDTVIVRLINDLPYPTGIHWHGIELNNYSDGTEVTQDEVAAGTPPIQNLGGTGVPAGGTFLYKFKVTRPGIFWYHPHHGNSSNRVFRGLYGMIVVTGLDEVTLVGNTLPSAAETKQIVLSDITVCNGNTVALNPPYDPTLPWAGPGGVLLPQPGTTPASLCVTSAVNDAGTAPPVPPYALGDVPSIMGPGRINEGNTVLTNGVNVGGRGGTPSAPAAVPLDATTHRLPVLSGQGLRLQLVNCATVRYFRLILTYDNGVTGVQVPLVRVGGEGGLLDNAVVEGPVGAFDPKYTSGEILLPPSARADVVVAIPTGLTTGTVLTLWTQDFQRLEGSSPSGFVNIPTVPVMHLEVISGIGTYIGITAGTPLRAKVGFPVVGTGPLVEPLGTATPPMLLDPGTIGKTGMPNPDIQLTKGPPPSINTVDGMDLMGHMVMGLHVPYTHYTDAPHIGSSRYAEVGRILELTVTNMTSAHHPFHLHGFSMQPKSLAPRTSAPAPTPASTTGTFMWPYQEFRDSINVPANYTLTFRVRLDDRTLVDGVTLGGWLGRWLFHCHIFFHHHRGMISEFVVTDANGKERPYVNVGGSWAYALSGGTTTRRGTFFSPDGSNPVGLLASLYRHDGTLEPLTPAQAAVTIDTAPSATVAGNWSWTNPATLSDGVYFLYITATDSLGLLGQAVLRLKVGMGDDGSDVGDPHIHTVDGKEYAFQAAGEFLLLRDRENGLEIQSRQTPLASANPFTDNYTGLTSSVSVNTAVAARVGSHRIAYQPGEVRGNGQLQFFLDGRPTRLLTEGIDLESDRVSAFDANGEMGLRVDYSNGAVLTVTPRLWYIWILDVSVWHTHADAAEGIMGSIPENTWLPTLPNGATVGPMPQSPHERYLVLYKTFADAWRLTDATSLFVYAKETSTETFTDRDWPAEEPPSILKPQFEIPGFPTPVNIPVVEAEQICQGVTMDDLHANCVFDVATTGDKGFAKAYLLQQDMRLHGSTVQIVGDKELTRPGESLVVTATVLPMTNGRPTPTGSVAFMVDGVAAGPPVKLDNKGRADQTLNHLAVGAHKIRAVYTPGGGEDSYQSSSSPNLLHTVEKGPDSTGGSKFGCWWVIWILIILILIAIAAYWYFS